MKPKTTPDKPTVAQLASLAATLSRAGKSDSQSLVQHAMGLWNAAQKLLFPPPPVPLARQDFPTPEKYPVETDEFLRLMMPNLSKKKRNDTFRIYLGFRLSNPLTGTERRYSASQFQILRCCNELSPSPFDQAEASEPSPKNLDNLIKDWEDNAIPASDDFRFHARLFSKWYEPWHAERVSEAHRAAGSKGLKSQKNGKGKSRGKDDGRRGARPPRERFREAIEAVKKRT